MTGKRSQHPPRWQGGRDVLLSVASGLLFVALFALSYRAVPPDDYEVRDDGVITMSHARNLAEYGSIGVNPSGSRVEGFSAPVQFFVFFLAYAFTGAGPRAFAYWQTTLCTFLIGFVFFQFFKENRRLGFALAVLGGLMLSQFKSFLEWHASGMENAITHAAMIVTLYCLYKMIRDGRTYPAFIVPVFLASVSRIEGMYYVAPLLVVFVVAWWRLHRNRAGLFLALGVALLWVAFNAWRYLYFGAILPNTAPAQSISVAQNLAHLVRWDPSYLSATVRNADVLLQLHGGYLLIFLLPLLAWVRRDAGPVFLLAALLCTFVASAANPFVFGPARLDPGRTTSHLAVIVTLFMCATVFWLQRGRWLILCLPLLLPVIYLVYKVVDRPPYELCCPASRFEKTRVAFAELATQEALPRPTVANPDLGDVSWHKQFNIVDLGLLGDPVMARLHGGEVAEYLFEFAAPDFLESHGPWSCRYRAYLFADPRFDDVYEPVRVRESHVAACGETPVPEGIWIRRAIRKGADTEERRLIDRLAAGPSVAAIRASLDECRTTRRGPCRDIARTAYRFLPEFIRTGQYDALDAAFHEGEPDPYALAMVESPYRPGWWRDAVAAVRRHAGARPPG